MGDGKVKLGIGTTPTGITQASAEFPLLALLTRLWPWFGRRDAQVKLGDVLLEKVREGTLTKDEAGQLGFLLGPMQRKSENVSQILEVAERVYSEPTPPLLPPASGAGPGASRLSEDWFATFIDAGGLVNDEILREIFARLLVSEVRTPGSCSPLTLAALRSLDRVAAEAFARAIPLTFNDCLPYLPELLDSHGLPFGNLMELEEAGLLHADGDVRRMINPPGELMVMKSHVIVALVEKPARLPCYRLRRAGVDLARVSNLESRPENVAAIAEWARSQIGGTVKWAVRPNDWNGRSDSIRDWTETKAAEASAAGVA